MKFFLLGRANLIPAILLLQIPQALSGEQELLVLMQRMARDTLALRDVFEELYKNRCSSMTLNACYGNNYDDCVSEYPQQTCPTQDEMVIPECGDAAHCNGLLDKTVSSVHIPQALATGNNGNPTDNKVIESVCYTLQAEDWMREKYHRDASFWDQYNINSPWMYVASQDGSYRIFPARHTKTCGSYDPRKRPWYIAASSGPKDVLLVLDTSGSMGNYNRLNVAKEAAKTIIETLTVGDRVAVVQFNDDAAILGSVNTLLRATKQNQDMLTEEIDKLYAAGSTNYLQAFEAAYDVIENTISNEWDTGCNIAILFLTDGHMNLPAGVTAQNVIDRVIARKESVENRDSNRKRAVYTFTYSFGQEADKTLPKRIACETGGLWSAVQDEALGGDLVTSMSNYYKLFALGLGEGENADFTAWVEPYHFHTGGQLGTTVSAPIYDRTVTPHMYLGAVGIDSLLTALNQALGDDTANSKILERLIQASTASCPRLNLSTCELESLRLLGGGEEALCAANCTSFVGIVPEQCSTVTDYPQNLWKNTNNKGKSYEERVCCEAGGSGPASTCASIQADSPLEDGRGKNNANGPIIGIAVGAAFFAMVAFCVCWRLKKHHRSRSKDDQTTNVGCSHKAATTNSAPVGQQDPTVECADPNSSGPVALPPPVSPFFGRASAPPAY